MSDGKEVKRLWVLFKLGKDESTHQITDVSMNPLQGAIEVMPVTDHDRIVAGLKIYASELELKIADLILFPDQESSLKTIAELRAKVEKLRENPGCWTDGFPPHPYDKEWFIAETTYGDRVVLKRLPEEWSYDFKTADETFIKKERIKRWMQFPDSEYKSPLETTIARQVREAEVLKAVIEKLRDKLEEIRWSWANDAGRQCDNLAFEALAAIERAEGEKE